MIDRQAILQEVIELSGVATIPMREYEFTAAQYAEVANCNVGTAKIRLDKMVQQGQLRSGPRIGEHNRPVTAYWRVEDEEENHA